MDFQIGDNQLIQILEEYSLEELEKIREMIFNPTSKLEDEKFMSQVLKRPITKPELSALVGNLKDHQEVKRILTFVDDIIEKKKSG